MNKKKMNWTNYSLVAIVIHERIGRKKSDERNFDKKSVVHIIMFQLSMNNFSQTYQSEKNQKVKMKKTQNGPNLPSQTSKSRGLLLSTIRIPIFLTPFQWKKLLL